MAYAPPTIGNYSYSYTVDGQENDATLLVSPSNSRDAADMTLITESFIIPKDILEFVYERKSDGMHIASFRHHAADEKDKYRPVGSSLYLPSEAASAGSWTVMLRGPKGYINYNLHGAGREMLTVDGEQVTTAKIEVERHWSESGYNLAQRAILNVDLRTGVVIQEDGANDPGSPASHHYRLAAKSLHPRPQ